MTAIATITDEPRATQLESVVAAHQAFRLRPIMRQGTASSIPEAWTRYATLPEARQAVKSMYHDDRGEIDR